MGQSDFSQGQGTPSKRVLVVEDELSIRQGLCDVLRFRGHTVSGVETGDEGLKRGLDEKWDLIVLDIMLPGLSGYLVCQRLRAAGLEVPVLMLTAKGEEDDVVQGFEAGADDYVTKPFGVRELMARVDALLRRSKRSGPSAGGAESFSVGPVEVSSEKSLARVGATRIDLTEREVSILRVLAMEPGHIVSRRKLLQLAWGMNNVDRIETRTVDMHIANLRKKLGTHGTVIETVRGQGYRVRG